MFWRGCINSGPVNIGLWECLSAMRRSGWSPSIVPNDRESNVLGDARDTADADRDRFKDPIPEIHTTPQGEIISSVLSAEQIVELARLRDFL